MGTPSPVSDTEIHSSLLPNSDHGRLRQLGYKQELSRKLSALSSFSVTFSVISVITGLTTTYGVGLDYGGPFTIIYGWPLVGLMTMTVGVSMAEICSAYPTSGGLYFWSAKLCGDRLGPFASWITGWIDTLELIVFPDHRTTCVIGLIAGVLLLAVINLSSV